jgi:signal transduction histidine kinase
VRVWRDWAVVGVVVLSTVLEGSFRSDVVWRPVATALALVLVWSLLWRRARPLEMVAIVFGSLIVLSVFSIATDSGEVGLYTTAFVLLLPYALFRWGSGREVILGLPIILVAYALGVAADYTSVGDTVAAFAFGLFPAGLGALVRYQASYQANEKEQIKMREREQLARELHDTVAHHVSAIAVRAQAGQVVAATDPQAAVDSLRVVEEEATRALTEMRLMVGTLREGEEADLAPQRGIADIERLAQGSGDSPPVTVEFSGALDDLPPSVGVAVYRLTQESITNALRHARHATRIDVTLDADTQWVRLTVTDDGDPIPAGRGKPGYGIVGMSERAALLGGTLTAGPHPLRGWVVSAELPKSGATV